MRKNASAIILRLYGIRGQARCSYKNASKQTRQHATLLIFFDTLNKRTNKAIYWGSMLPKKSVWKNIKRPQYSYWILLVTNISIFPNFLPNIRSSHCLSKYSELPIFTKTIERSQYLVKYIRFPKFEPTLNIWPNLTVAKSCVCPTKVTCCETIIGFDNNISMVMQNLFLEILRRTTGVRVWYFITIFFTKYYIESIRHQVAGIDYQELSIRSQVSVIKYQY